MLIIKRLILAASAVLAGPGLAQVSAVSPAEPERTVEGATPGRVTQVERCQGHKFESVVEIDPVSKRSTRVKLCANPGASDADWIKTLQAAVAQIEQRNMPPEAREKLIAELKIEMARFSGASKATVAPPVGAFTLGGTSTGSKSLIEPSERFETSTLPPLPTSRKRAATTTAVLSAPPQRPMSIRIKCLARREAGPGATCDFFDRGTSLAVSAVLGLEDGGRLRFRRRGEDKGEVVLAPLQAGQSVRVALPLELCRGVANSKVEIELLGPQSTGSVAARFGPYGLRC